MTERVYQRRRASDRADERAARAQRLGDLIGMWVATGQADHARRLRAEWAELFGEPSVEPSDQPTETPPVPTQPTPALSGGDS